MKINFNLFLISTVGAIFTLSCSQLDKKSLRTSKKCDISNLSSNGPQNYIYDGCDLDTKILTTLPDSKSTIAVIIPNNKGACTGTFIGDHTILTAAHCFDIKKLSGPINNIKEEIDSIKIISAQTIDEKNHIPYQFIAKVTDIKIHPHYKEYCENNSTQNKQDGEKGKPLSICNFADLAILKTDKSASEISAGVAKVTSNIKNNEMVLFVGYGKFSDEDTENTIIKRWGISYLYSYDQFNEDPIQLPNQTQSSIQDFYKIYMTPYIHPDFQNDPQKSFLFTKGLENENGICNGDSGGPVFVKRENKFFIAGVVSANLSSVSNNDNSNNCYEKQSINMRIGAYIEWIRNKTQENGDPLSEY